jgi:transcriptional regulator with XRE-family HTH domain
MLAEEAGLSRSTVARLADGNNVSLDSFIRILQALGLSGHLKALLPDPDIRPVEQVKFRGGQRRRAGGIESSPCRLHKEGGRTHFMTRRFDRTASGKKLHMQSLAGMMH